MYTKYTFVYKYEPTQHIPNRMVQTLSTDYDVITRQLEGAGLQYKNGGLLICRSSSLGKIIEMDFLNRMICG